MKIAALEQDGPSSHIPEFNFLLFPFQPKIKIKEWSDNTEERYGTTIHELAHSAHRSLDPTRYSSLVSRGYVLPCVTFSGCNDPSNSDHQSARRLLETWATTVEI